MSYTVTVTRDGTEIYTHDTSDEDEARRIAEAQHQRIQLYGDFGEYSIGVRFDFLID